MIPSSLWGAALFVVLLAPGARLRAAARAGRSRSLAQPVPGSLRVVFVSIVCLVVTGLIAAGVRALWPRHTPNVRALVLDPAAYWRGHHVMVAWWSLAFVTFATLLGAAAAHRQVVRAVRWLTARRPVRWLTGSTDGDIADVSAWHKVMNWYQQRLLIYVGAALDDGTYVEGYLVSFNANAVENTDREMLLSGPLYLTTTDGARRLLGTQFMVLSARRIVRLDVTHVQPPAEFAPDPAGSASPAAGDTARGIAAGMTPETPGETAVVPPAPSPRAAQAEPPGA